MDESTKIYQDAIKNILKLVEHLKKENQLIENLSGEAQKEDSSHEFEQDPIAAISDQQIRERIRAKYNDLLKELQMEQERKEGRRRVEEFENLKSQLLYKQQEQKKKQNDLKELECEEQKKKESIQELKKDLDFKIESLENQLSKLQGQADEYIKQEKVYDSLTAEREQVEQEYEKLCEEYERKRKELRDMI